VVGDRVSVLIGAARDGSVPRVVERHTRRNVFVRADADAIPKNLAANIDQVAVCTSFGSPGFSSLVSDRVLAAVALCGVPAVMILNKIDLANPEQLEKIEATYRGAGVTVIRTSATEGLGIEELITSLRGKRSALYGVSGAGKSSLINAMVPKLGGQKIDLRTGEVSRSMKFGRHTTSASTMYDLGGDVTVIDTPGVRSFIPYGLSRVRLWELFPEMVALADTCKAKQKCTHMNEAVDHCAIMSGVRDGTFPESRYTSYAHMMLEDYR